MLRRTQEAASGHAGSEEDEQPEHPAFGDRHHPAAAAEGARARGRDGEVGQGEDRPSAETRQLEEGLFPSRCRIHVASAGRGIAEHDTPERDRDGDRSEAHNERRPPDYEKYYLASERGGGVVHRVAPA